MNLTVKDLMCLENAAAYHLDTLGRKTFAGVSIDSRSVKRGEVFIAIRGENFDGHQFVEQAFAKGASCAVIDARTDSARWQSKPVLVVDDTTKTLGRLANIYRKKFSIPVLAVAGSNGKTTTKEMITAVLNTRYTVLSTHGNLNNHIGVPQTLFHLKPKHEVAVIEIGTNHFGEIMYLCNILEPTHGIITNIGREHLQFFHDLEGVARAEGELFSALGKSGVGFINRDDERVVAQAKPVQKKVTYSFSKRSSDIHGKFLRVHEDGCAEFAVSSGKGKKFAIQLSIPGKHVMINALAATAIGLTFKVPPKEIQKSLKNFNAVGKRMEVVRVGDITIVNDAYNANPDSVLSALEALQAMKCKGKKIVILADMRELGDASQLEHERIGDAIGSMGFEFLLTYGEMARHIYTRANVRTKIHYDQKNILSEYAAELLSAGDIVLVKGSRGMKMEDVVTFLVDRLEKNAA
ncbi:MAG: UDP-N-acetylmuramoyl-tripeptide--D-alanyl-D-alanine ligase [Ignavibacteria bacterium]|nr:UDP-N-acetylmuramoyl-tripeptide--D-alanyl-D-alanine ligase [Ignavibacteria bacterium]MBI3766412.1 UDP-N-acetylmuramoyl-tripeptide--D-alanyl-D-alanine ligase [Ignavibacteriales bacterium]